MKVEYHRKFLKSFKKLDKKMQSKVIQAVDIFKSDPHSPELQNHSLKGSMKGLRAVSVTGDFRIIFEEQDNYVIVFMLDVGTHAQVYDM